MLNVMIKNLCNLSKQKTQLFREDVGVGGWGR